MAQNETSGLPSQYARYSDLFEKMLDAAVLLDPTTFAVLDANPSCTWLFNLNLDQILGKQIFQWVKEYERDSFKKALEVARSLNQPLQINSRFQNGTHKFLLVRVVICTLQLSNKSEVLQLIAKDITEEHVAKQKSVDQLVKIAEMNRKLEALSVTDEMTKLFNFRCFRDKLLLEHDRSQRYGLVYSLVFCDLDHFKHYNDHNGHQAGDELLKQLAQILQNGTRTTDIVARYGGEEFVVICPETPELNAMILADRIRKKVEEFQFPFGVAQPLGKVSISVGVSSYPKDGSTAEDVLKAADQAVYSSKNKGRNTVTLAGDVDKAQLPESDKKL